MDSNLDFAVSKDANFPGKGRAYMLSTWLKEELPSTAPTASTATQDNGGGKTSSPSARLCSCQGTIASHKKGPQRARSFTSVIDRACNMTQYCSTAQFQQHRQQQQHASSSPHATQRSKTPRYLSYLRILVTPSMSAMLTAGAAAGGTLTRNLAGGRYFTGQS